MRQFSLNLDKKYKRPVVLLKNGLMALLDTGAYIPVWTDEEDILIVTVRKRLRQSCFVRWTGRVRQRLWTNGRALGRLPLAGNAGS